MYPLRGNNGNRSNSHSRDNAEHDMIKEGDISRESFHKKLLM